MARHMRLIWSRLQALIPKIGSRAPAANWHDGQMQNGEAHPAFFLLAVFPRDDTFAAAFFRVMCDFSAAPMRD